MGEEKLLLSEILKNGSLDEWIELLNSSELSKNPRTMDDFLLGIGFYSCLGPTDDHKDYFVPKDAEQAVNELVFFAQNLISKYDSSEYDREDPFGLWLTSIDALAYLSMEEISNRISSFNSFVDQDTNNLYDGQTIVPRLINSVLAKLVEEYHERFNELDKRNIGVANSEYSEILDEMRSDLDRFQAYAKNKLELNILHKPQANKISYQGCFPEKVKSKDVDFKALTWKYIRTLTELRDPDPSEGYKLISHKKVMELIHPGKDSKKAASKVTDEQIAVYTLIHYFGVPLRLEIHGKHNQDRVRFTLFFDNPNKMNGTPNPFGVKILYEKGLNPTEKNIYTLLHEIVTKERQFDDRTKKFGNYVKGF